MDSFMRRWEIQGASLAIMRGDSLVYAKGYGWADREKGERMQPGNIMRMASVSKLITAIGIMTLHERMQLSLETPVFGPFGILNEYDKYIRDDNYYLITVEDLLRHSAGFTQRGGDPMFSTRDVMRRYGLITPPDSDMLTRCLVSSPLAYEPGTWHEYSNFGYLLLSMIIEKVSGMSYEDYIQKNVLNKAGCYDFHIGGIYYEDRFPGEVRYYGTRDDRPIPEYNGSGQLVPRWYGGNNITALSGAGAWVGSTIELMRLVASVDGRLGVKDILTPFSVFQMTQYIDEDSYGLGWIDTSEDGVWTRTGTLSGTSALIKYYPDGECWIMITNTSTWKGPRFTRETAGLFTKLRSRFSPDLPRKNLFRIR
ncbi:MAG: beta-lactamase family protein [Bacteroidales bacterium]|nr:beta-lactamase family protein [Bacteroidales bacterium]